MILHLCHGLFGNNNGVDCYISAFIKCFSKSNNLIIVPAGKNFSKLKNVIEIESLEDLPELVKKINPEFLIIHWTGAECFKDNHNLVKYGEKFIHLSNHENIDSIDYNPFAYANAAGFWLPETRKHKTIMICHTEYKLPLHINFVFLDAVINVSYKTFWQNRNLQVNNFVIYPTVRPEFFKRTKPNTRQKKDKKIVIGFLGRLNKYEMGTYKFIKLLYSNDKRLKFIFAGKDILDKEPPENFYFPGTMEAKTFFNQIDIFLYPTRLDSFSLALLEAMLQSKPCLVPPVVSELASLGGAYIYNNEAELAKRLEIIIRNLSAEKTKALKASGKLSKIFSNQVFKLNFQNIFNYLES